MPPDGFIIPLERVVDHIRNSSPLIEISQPLGRPPGNDSKGDDPPRTYSTIGGNNNRLVNTIWLQKTEHYIAKSTDHKSMILMDYNVAHNDLCKEKPFAADMDVHLQLLRFFKKVLGFKLSQYLLNSGVPYSDIWHFIFGDKF